MTKTKTNVKAGKLSEQRSTELEAQLAFEQELLTGSVIDVLTALLEASGISRRELAERLDVTEGRVSQILSGRENLTLRSLATLGWALGLRFHLAPIELDQRAGTPAEGDAPAPDWLGGLQDRLAQSSASGGEATMPRPSQEQGRPGQRTASATRRQATRSR
jgi:transcriptional regulator with XRE-family HTH domain